MASRWVQSVSLLVLLAVLWSGSQAGVPTMRLCGSELVDALQMICGDRGFYFNLRRGSRDGVLPPKTGAGPGSEKIYGSVLEQCCFKSCGLIDLENYCV